jgi:hypothetical protein
MAGRRPSGSSDEWSDEGAEEFFPEETSEEKMKAAFDQMRLEYEASPESTADKIANATGKVVATAVLVTVAVVIVCVCIAVVVWAVKLVIP